MNRLKYTALLALVAAAWTATAGAQDCNLTEGRLTIVDRDGQPHPGGGLHLCLGSAPYLNGYVLTARDSDGDRGAFLIVGAGGSALTQDSYLCLSEYDDTVTIEDGSNSGDCNGAGLEPFDYGSHSLTLYAFDGNDHIHGGLGQDFLYGGDGDDDLWSGSAGDDELVVGGEGNDALWGGEGRNTELNAGAGDDTLADAGGGGTTLIGGGGKDFIDAGLCDEISYLTCGEGDYDTVVVPRAGQIPSTEGCETIERSGDPFC